MTVAWTGTHDDLVSWLACDDAAILKRAQAAKRSTIIAAGGEIG